MENIQGYSEWLNESAGSGITSAKDADWGKIRDILVKTNPAPVVKDYKSKSNSAPMQKIVWGKPEDKGAKWGFHLNSDGKGLKFTFGDMPEAAQNKTKTEIVKWFQSKGYKMNPVELAQAMKDKSIDGLIRFKADQKKAAEDINGLLKKFPLK